ncbi:hypothetical protein MGN70_002232 [Eutypa lata]|nr:hypothetical protein MGN70_002232 [Eutypa lata]
MGKPSKKASSHGNWSDPIFHEAYQQWYTQRIGRNGDIEYNWIGPNLPTGDDTTPRSQPPVDQITQGVQDMSIGHANYGGQQQYASYPTQQADQQTSGALYAQQDVPNTDTAGGPSSPVYTHHGAVAVEPSTGKGKGRARAEDEQPVNPHLPSSQSSPQPIDPGFGLSQGGYRHQGGLEPVSSNFPLTNSGTATYPASYQGSHGGDAYGNVDDDNSANDAELQQALTASRNLQYSRGRAGESSAYVEPTTPYRQVDPSTYNYAAEDEEEDDGNITPRGTSPTRHTESHISGTTGSIEVLDPRFVVEHSFRYQPGEVLKILWSEPRGAAGAPVAYGAPNGPFSEWEEKATDEGPFYVGYRRFIVVRTDEGHSTCIPISTYEGKACKKKGVRASKHGIVYENGRHRKPPRLLKNEPVLGYNPVGLDIYAPNEKLAAESRVNYSKLVTIEHNVKVFFIGRVIQQDLDYLQEAVNDCWGKKKTERSSRKPRR